MANRFHTPFKPTDNLFRWGPIPGRLLAVSHWVEIFQHRRRRLHQYYWPAGLTMFRRGKMLHVCAQDVLDREGTRVFHDFILGRNRRKGWNEWSAQLKSLNASLRAFHHIDVATLSNAALISEWRALNASIRTFWPSALIPELGAYGGQTLLHKALQRERLSPEEFHHAYATLSATARPSFYQEEELALASLLNLRNHAVQRRAIERHTLLYRWIGNSYGRMFRTPQATFVSRLEQLNRHHQNTDTLHRKILADATALQIAKRRVLRGRKHSAMLRRLSQGIAWCVWWQDQRKKHIFRYLEAVDTFAREFEHRAGIPTGAYDYAYFWEVTLKPTARFRSVLTQRKEQFVTIIKGWHNPELLGTSARHIIERYWSISTDVTAGDLHGIPTYTGKKSVHGSVFVIKNYHDLARFPKGHVLVAAMTAPEYVVAMRKASAIVTDTGGITSHAAIVSRELKIPCIVGTKYATHLLKTGDRVEVDANAGVVRKL